MVEVLSEGKCGRAALQAGAMRREIRAARFSLTVPEGWLTERCEHRPGFGPCRSVDAKQLRLPDSIGHLPRSSELRIMLSKLATFAHAHHAVMLPVLTPARRKPRLSVRCAGKERYGNRKSEELPATGWRAALQ